MTEYALNATPRQGLRRSVMSQLHTCPGPVASSTGASRGVRLLLARRVGTTGRADWSSIPAAIRHHERREASITASSQAAANEWSTETPFSHPAVIRASTAARSRRTDPRGVGPIRLRDRLGDPSAWVVPVVPRRPRQPHDLQRPQRVAGLHLVLPDRVISRVAQMQCLQSRLPAR